MDRKTENQLRQEIAEVWALLDAERAGRAALIRRIEQEEQSVPVEVSDSPCAEADGCPTEKSVLQRFWREAQSVAVVGEPVAVTGDPIAILRREIGEDTWFDWTPVKPGSDEHRRLRAAGEMDYCEVYQRHTQSIPASKLAALREKAESVSDGWKGWRDVYVHGYPEAAQEVLFARGGITVHGAFIGGIFWHSNEKCAAALWMPLPTPLTPDEHRAMIAAIAQGQTK